MLEFVIGCGKCGKLFDDILEPLQGFILPPMNECPICKHLSVRSVRCYWTHDVKQIIRKGWDSKLTEFVKNPKEFVIEVVNPVLVKENKAQIKIADKNGKVELLIEK